VEPALNRAHAPLIAVGAVGCAAALAVVLISGSAAPVPPPSAAAATTSLSRGDAEFVRAMVAQHEQTAAIVRLARSRITDGELATLVAAVDATQSDELAMMDGWLAAASSGAAVPSATGHAHPPPGGSPDARDVAALDAAPAGQFDAALANLLIARQQAATELARAELAGNGDPAVLAFARRVADSRAAQVSQLLRMVVRLRT
jgi:uncharacterized protein (DUF305 family)